MNTIKIKPLSINEAWQGKRFKTPKYKAWRLEMSLKLPKLVIPKGLLKVNMIIGFSNSLADIDNVVKGILDAFQDKYNFNDRDIYELNLRKEIVPKGEEYIKFKIENL